jgi:hypothetical protein
MTEQQQQELLEEKLATFGLSPLEAAVLTILGKTPTNLTLQEIQKHLSPTVHVRKIHLRKCLKKMHETIWISTTKAFPNTYTIVAKKQLQKNLEAIITTSQLAFQTQKKYYRSILKLLQNLQEPASSIQSKISIPKSSPVFLRRFIEDIAQKFQLTLIKIETNMVIALRRENIFFRLNSAEFEYQKDGRAHNCGIVFCMVDDPKILPTNITKIHQYNANGLKFSYKLEAKGYSDRKKRDLSEYAVDPSPQKDELLKSNIKLVTSKKTYKGTIETIPLTKNPLYCASIWKETTDPKLDLLTPVKVLQNLQENDTILK